MHYRPVSDAKSQPSIQNKPARLKLRTNGNGELRGGAPHADVVNVAVIRKTVGAWAAGVNQDSGPEIGNAKSCFRHNVHALQRLAPCKIFDATHYLVSLKFRNSGETLNRSRRQIPVSCAVLRIEIRRS